MNRSLSPQCTAAILNSYGSNSSGTFYSRIHRQVQVSDRTALLRIPISALAFRPMFTITAKLTLDFLDLKLAGPTERAGSPITLPFDGSGLHKAVIINVPVRRPHSPITTVLRNTSPFLQAGDCTLITLCKGSYCSLTIYIHPSAKLCWGKHVFKMKSALLDIEGKVAACTLVDIVGIESRSQQNAHN